MSAFAVAPTILGDARRPQISALPNVSMILGHVLVARQRSRSPDFPRPRAASSQSSHHTGDSRPSSYNETVPPGSEKRRFMSSTRDAMCGLLPSHTTRPFSSWLKPSRMNALRNVPDCELPSETPQRMFPATGFGVPVSSCLSYRKKELMSRVAANPIPSTSGSFTVYCSSYSRARSNPLFRQTWAGSGVPGNGACEQSANAQSLLEIFTSPLFTPVALSDEADTRVAFVVSSVRGGYGDGVARGMISAAVLPLCPTNRITSGPAMLAPSGFLARGT